MEDAAEGAFDELVWSKDKVLKLIQMYRERQLLWNATNSFYKDKNKKNYARLEIADELIATKADVKTKIRNLTTQFKLHKKRFLDEFDAFGEYVAGQLRKCTDLRQMAVTKHRNNQALFDLEIANLPSNQPTPNISMPSRMSYETDEFEKASDNYNNNGDEYAKIGSKCFLTLRNVLNGLAIREGACSLNLKYPVCSEGMKTRIKGGN
ncbi:hypothetical protein J6590_043393 [Homalodisca vitripennis]|nr:hypothetical protein J6590_043393 [Homalodisca vitripennis]